MRLAVISDIHGNAMALDAVLADLARRPADAMICLGDCIQGGPQPAEVVAKLRELGCPTVMGNADAWLLTGVETSGRPQPPERQRILDDVRAWSLTKLSPADREFIAAFQPTVSATVDGRSLLGFHGSPGSWDEILLPDTPKEEFERMLGPAAVELMCGGHVHLQFQRRTPASLHFNPGSVGVSYLHDLPPGAPGIDPWAEYAVVESDRGLLSIDFRRVPYDVERYLELLHASGRPHADDAIRQYRPRG